MMLTTLYFEAPYQVAHRQEAIPTPASNQLLIQTLFSAISAGTEMLVYRGQLPRGIAVDETISSLAGSFDYPLKYGYALVGRVIEVGAALDQEWWQDRLVFAFHPHQSHFIATPDDVLPLPAELEPEDALFLPNMETAVSFFMDGQPTIGEQVLIFGQGIVGLLTTRLLSSLPLAHLITLDPYPYRRQQALSWGADAAFDPISSHHLAGLRTALERHSPDARADLTYELSGNPHALAQAIELTGFGGRLVVGSWYGQKEVSLPLGGHFHRSHMQIISSQVSHLAPKWHARWTKARRLQVVWEMLAKHQPHALISHRIPFSQAADAYHLLEQQPADVLQVIFTYDSSLI